VEGYIKEKNYNEIKNLKKIEFFYNRKSKFVEGDVENFKKFVKEIFKFSELIYSEKF